MFKVQLKNWKLKTKKKNECFGKKLGIKIDKNLNSFFKTLFKKNIKKTPCDTNDVPEKNSVALLDCDNGITKHDNVDDIKSSSNN